MSCDVLTQTQTLLLLPSPRMAPPAAYGQAVSLPPPQVWERGRGLVWCAWARPQARAQARMQTQLHGAASEPSLLSPPQLL